MKKYLFSLVFPIFCIASDIDLNQPDIPEVEQIQKIKRKKTVDTIPQTVEQSRRIPERLAPFTVIYTGITKKYVSQPYEI